MTSKEAIPVRSAAPGRASAAKRWAGRGSWSLVDQGSFALANFLINVLLARWLGASGYGQFSIAFAIFLLAGVVFAGLVVEPMMVFGAGRFRAASGGYLRTLERLQWRWGWLASAGVIGAVALFYPSAGASDALWVLALVSGPLFYLLLMRRACYVTAGPRPAGEAGMLYLGLCLVLVFALDRARLLGAGSALGVMALASLVAGFWVRSRLARRPAEESAAPAVREIVDSHWSYGRWAVLTGVASWVPANIYLLLLPLVGGEQASGEFKAATNLILPVMQVQAAAGPLLLPALVRARDTRGFGTKIRTAMWIFLVPPLLWTAVLALCGPWLADLLYDGGIPVGRTALVIFGLAATASSLVWVIAGALKAIEQPRQVLWGYLLATAICGIVGLPLMFRAGVSGAAMGMLAATLANAAVLAIHLRVQLKKRQPASPTASA